jgi:outer membrane protein OmpA-like peptidoglycan-associated protein
MTMAAAFLLCVATPGRGTQNPAGNQPIYTVTIDVVERTTKSIDYHNRIGQTGIDFFGTILLPASRGEAKVTNRRTFNEIEAVFLDLQSATLFGPELLTYVVWAVTPEGRTINLGEVVADGSTSKLSVATELQAFGLIVTAEPYFSVTQPSDVVVMEGFVGKQPEGGAGEIVTKYNLLPRGQYLVNAPAADRTPMVLDRNTPLLLHEARNAVRIARWAGANVSASDTFQKASNLLAQAEGSRAIQSGAGTEAIAREAVQTAEAARLIALKTQSEARIAREREESSARAAAVSAAIAQAMIDSGNIERARQATQAQTDGLALKVVPDKSGRDKQEVRSKLLVELNAVVRTEDSARGLIVKLSDVLFDTGQYSLNPEAREKLSKISRIVLAYPALKVDVEGYTDSVGPEQSNLVLSEMRAKSIREVLTKDGIAASSISTKGFGEDRPVATNDTAAGRQQNRRVDLVISGEIIGAVRP